MNVGDNVKKLEPTSAGNIQGAAALRALWHYTKSLNIEQP
jgi:hypothetical protein